MLSPASERAAAWLAAIAAEVRASFPYTGDGVRGKSSWIMATWREYHMKLQTQATRTEPTAAHAAPNGPLLEHTSTGNLHTRPPTFPKGSVLGVIEGTQGVGAISVEPPSSFSSFLKPPSPRGWPGIGGWPGPGAPGTGAWAWAVKQ